MARMVRLTVKPERIWPGSSGIVAPTLFTLVDCRRFSPFPSFSSTLAQKAQLFNIMHLLRAKFTSQLNSGSRQISSLARRPPHYHGQTLR